MAWNTRRYRVVSKSRHVRLMGRSTTAGFHIYGNISTEALLEAATEALLASRVAKPTWRCIPTAARIS